MSHCCTVRRSSIISSRTSCSTPYRHTARCPCEYVQTPSFSTQITSARPPKPRILPVHHLSSRIPSLSNLLLASSSAQVCILPITLATSHKRQAFRRKTHEVSSFITYNPTATTQLPQNPYQNKFSHPSFSYFSPGRIPHNQPPGGS